MITYKQVNNLQYLHADSLDTAVAVWEQLVGKDEHVLVSYMTDVDDPRDVTFIVGAVNEEILHEFIIQNAELLSQLSPLASEFIKKHYTGELNASGKVRPVIYLDEDQVAGGPEADGSVWHEMKLHMTCTKYYIRNFWKVEQRVKGTFVKLAD